MIYILVRKCVLNCLVSFRQPSKWPSSHSTRSTSLQAQASAFLDDVRRNPRVWELCCQRFAQTSHPEVQFWCARTLHEVRLPTQPRMGSMVQVFAPFSPDIFCFIHVLLSICGFVG